MCNLCCLAPPKFCWSCQAPRPSNLKPCKYCYAEPRERYAEPRERYAEPREPCKFIISKNTNQPPPPPPIND